MRFKFFWWRKKRTQSSAPGPGGANHAGNPLNQAVHAGFEAASGPPGIVPSPDDTSEEKRSYRPLISRQHSLPSSVDDRFTVVECPSRELALSNCLLVHPFDFRPGTYVIVNDRFPLTTKYDNTSTLIPGQVGASISQRQWMGLPPMGAEIMISPFGPPPAEFHMTSLQLEVDFWIRGLEIAQQFSSDELVKSFIKSFKGLIFGMDQQLIFDFRGQVLKAFVKDMGVLNLTPPNGVNFGFGILMEKTEVRLIKATGSRMKIGNTGRDKRTLPAILAPSFRFSDFGVGGLDEEFKIIFRRAIASRVLPPGLVNDIGLQHINGILLFGPPGTGKTLLARQICKIVGACEPKILNGSEILYRYAGALEENIRKIFADVEKEFEGTSGLHIVIFDKLDTLCKQRSSCGNTVGDIVVNGILSKPDMIDEALLRPGRFEVHLEISLPDKRGRLEILEIHTSKMKRQGRLDTAVDLAELAALTTNFSGAELSALVRSAASYAFSRHSKIGVTASIIEDTETLRVNRDDFLHAIDEIRPALGASGEELEGYTRNGIIHFEENINTLLSNASFLVEQVRNPGGTPLVSILLYGSHGTGKTALAATIALASQFPFIKLLSPDDMVGLSEAQKVAAISKVFLDSYNSPLSVIMLDDIERLLGWVPVGPQFSNAILQVLLGFLQRRPPKGRRLLILVTTSNRDMLAELQMSDVFHTYLGVHPVSTLRSLECVLRSVDLFSNYEDRRRAMRHLDQAGFGRVKAEQPGAGRIQVGIKQLFNVITGMATRDPEDIIKGLVEALGDAEYDPTNSDTSMYEGTVE